MCFYYKSIINLYNKLFQRELHLKLKKEKH